MYHLQFAGAAESAATTTHLGQDVRMVMQDNGLPSLPPEHAAHTIWSFRDESGRFHYEFNLVYGPSTPGGTRGPTRRLDEDLSYWSVVWPVPFGSDGEHILGRSVSFARLRGQRGSRLTFKSFSSLLEMRGKLVELLHPGDVDPPRMN